ncbi:putative membrane protein [Bordetella holmesii 35009]|nr:putative membrane protein [Bordetella holmesii 35009]
MKTDTSYRLGVLSRTLAAIVGGYSATALITSALALLLSRSIAPATSVLASSLLAFAIYALLVLPMFRVATALRAWIWVMAWAAGAALLLLLLRVLS